MAITMYPLRLFIRKRIIFIPFFFSFLLVAAATAWLTLGVMPGAEQYVLHYTILFGVDRVGNFFGFYILPALGMGILTLNFLVSWILYAYDTFLSALVMVGTLFIEFAVFGFAAILVFLNT